MMDKNIASQKLDKTFFSVSSLQEEGDERAYWLNKSYTERLAALELIRQMLYGYDPSTTRLQRFFEIAKLK